LIRSPYRRDRRDDGERLLDSAAVDVHCHYVSKILLEVDPAFRVSQDDTWGSALYFGGRFLGPLMPALIDIDLVIQNMDQAGLSHRICCTASWLTCYWADPGLGQAVSRATNEAIARDVAKHPTRLLGLASLPVQDVDRAIDELVYAVNTLGLVGVALGSNVNGTYFDQPKFDPLLAAIEELNVPIFFHPDEVLGEERLQDYWLIRLIGNPHEAGAALAHLIFGGVLERFPNLKVCFPMGGGSFSQLLGRMTHSWKVTPEARAKAPRSPAEYLDRCFFDTIIHSPLSFEFILKTVSPGRLVLGSDYPWDMGLAEPRRVVEESSLSDEDCRGVLAGNLGGILGLSFSGSEDKVQG
jgi:aminocarboxymuconate-semialdehyde decarboxylase